MKHVAPDLILLDLSMPLMNGWSCVPSTPEKKEAARIILFTAHAWASVIAPSRGRDGYITKPFDVDGLVGIIARDLPAR